MSSITKAVRLLFSSGGSAPVAKGTGDSIPTQKGTLKKEHHHGGSIEQAESKGSSSKGRFLTPEFDPSAPRSFGVKRGTQLDDLNDIDPAKVEKLPAEMATENKKVRESIYSRISQSFSKFISYFAFPKMSFPKSMAAQKEEAIAKVLDGTGKKETVVALLKKENPMGTDNWASQQADRLIRGAYGKRAFDSLNVGGNESAIVSDLKKAIPDLINDKSKMITDIISFLKDPLIPDKAKKILKEKIATDNCSNDMFNNALESCTDADFNELVGKLRETIGAERLNHIETSDKPGEAAQKDPRNIPTNPLQYYRDIISFLRNPKVDYKVKQQCLDRINKGELPPETTDEDVAAAKKASISKVVTDPAVRDEKGSKGVGSII